MEDAHVRIVDAKAAKFEPHENKTKGTMEICKGDGDCIVSKHIDGYEMSCSHNCKPRECLNFLVCNSNQANSVMVVGSKLCFSCEVAFARPLVFVENVNCQICSTKAPKGVKRLGCDHSICFTCFKKAHYGDPPEKPAFPYEKSVEYDYMETEWDPKWAEDPLIKKYQIDYLAWVETLYNNFKECDPMRTCSECK